MVNNKTIKDSYCCIRSYPLKHICICTQVKKICFGWKMVLREIACCWKRRVKDRVSGSKKCGGRDVWMVCQGCFLLLQLTSQVRHWRRRNKKVRLNDHGCSNRRVPLRIVWFFLFLGNPLSRQFKCPLATWAYLPCDRFIPLYFIVRNSRAHRNERNRCTFSLLPPSTTPTRYFLSVESGR